jgi:hypothetical protein
MTMRFPARTFLTAAVVSVLATSGGTISGLAISGLAVSGLAVSGLATPALAEVPAPAAWELKPDMGYAYDKEGKTFSYKMGTSNAGLLLKGAKKVPKGTLFFIGQNGQLYMRTGPYLEGDGKFMFGSN